MDEQNTEITFNIDRNIHTMFDIVNTIDKENSNNEDKCYELSRVIMCIEQLDNNIRFQPTGLRMNDTVNNIILKDIQILLKHYKKELLNQIKFLVKE